MSYLEGISFALVKKVYLLSILFPHLKVTKFFL